MYSLARVTHAATGVEHSLYCNFFHTSEKSLVIAGSNIIRVFRLVPDVPIKSLGAQRREDQQQNVLPPKVKLECMATYTLHSNIDTMEVVSLNPARDSLLLGFKDAKLSVVEYNPKTHDLKTLSLHYFEKDDIKDGFFYNIHLPIVRVDTETRCATMLIYGRKLVVLPFRKDLANEDVDYNSPLARGPIMQSYVINPRDFESLRIDNVIDMQFLYGYYDPTLLLLYEPIKTFPGRVAVRHDTCCIAAISLNIRQRLNPVIWSLQNLPFDSFKILAVPKPIGGALLFASNSLIYLTQSVPPYGISLNSMGDKNTNFPLRRQEGVVISLDTVTAKFLTEDRVVISLKGGELYVLTLVADSMRSVRSFHLDKAASSVLTCCMSLCEDQYLFLGSRLGNSLLLRFTEKELAEPKVREKSNFPADQEPPSKKKKLDNLGDWIASNVEDIEDPDILEVYGTAATSSVQRLASYIFEVMDSLLNIGPCGAVAIGEPAFLSEEYEISTVDPCVELVCTSGHGKNGALSILQRSIKPQVLTTFDLPGVTEMWTVVGKQQDEKRASGLRDHSYLILSKGDCALVLRTEEEISELEESGFNTTDKTLLAGNIGNDGFIIQVTTGGIRLLDLDGTVQIQHVVVDVETSIVAATLADPYLIILTECGAIMVCSLITSRFAMPKLITKKIPHSKRSKIVTLCAYCDLSGLFTTDFPDDGSVKRKMIKSDAEIKKELDDEDEMLYASTTTSVFDPPKVFEPSQGVRKIIRWWKKWHNEARPSYWCATTRENGDFELFSVPDFTPAFLVKSLSIGHKVLIDVSEGGQTDQLKSSFHDHSPVINEILLVGLGNRSLRPILFARVGEDILMYEAFSFSDGLEPKQLKVRFRLIEHNLMLRSKDAPQPTNTLSRIPDRLRMLHRFSNISVYSGVFICGAYPHWVILTVRGEFRFHPMSVDGSVKCFAPFRNVNCQNGFLYFNRKDSLRICLLPTVLSYDAPWPVRKVPLRCTPHFISYHLETKTYCVITSNLEPTAKIWKFNGDDKEEFEEEREERFIKVQVPVFTAQLFSPINWQMIPNTDFDFEQWEHVTCCKNVLLSYEGDKSGHRGYIAIGTTTSYGEDITCRGRIIIFDVTDVVPEPGQPLTKNKLKVLYDMEQKGAVTSIAACCGKLISAVGQKVYIWELRSSSLVAIAFIDTQIYVHKLISVKNLIYGADIGKSVFLLRFQEELRTLSLVSKDMKNMHVYSIEFQVSGGHLGFIASDSEKNLVTYSYTPESKDSMGGTWLIRRGDMNLGCHINSFFRIRCRYEDVSGDGKISLSERKHATVFASLDGSLGYILPISEKMYRRFSMIYNLLVQNCPHMAGINPKTSRHFQSRHKLNLNPVRGILDWQLIMSFLHLPSNEKIDIAKKIGAKVDNIIEDITDVDRCCAHF